MGLTSSLPELTQVGGQGPPLQGWLGGCCHLPGQGIRAEEQNLGRRMVDLF